MTGATKTDTLKKTFGTDREIQALKIESKRYSVKDKTNNGLFIEVKPSQVKSWHYRYSLNGKQETLVIGRYPDIQLAEARALRNDAANKVSKGISPAAEKRDIRKAAHTGLTVFEYGQRYLKEVIKKDRSNSVPMERILNNDIYPFIGSKLMKDITTEDVRAVIWRKKEQGYDAAAIQTYGLLKRMFDYAPTSVAPFNPVLKIPARYVYKYIPRDRALSVDEIRKFYTVMLDSRIYRPRKLGLLLSLLTLVRKSEMNHARWEDIDFDNRIWHIPVTKKAAGERTSKPMQVYLSTQVIEIFRELKVLSQGEPYVFNGRQPNTHISHSLLNTAQKTALALTDVPHFTIHDLRRTSSTHLNEKGFNRDAIEACLNHTMGGIRGIYNRAIYEDIRIPMMQEWSDFIFQVIYEPNVIFFNAGKHRTA